jgi:hypothetical protein
MKLNKVALNHAKSLIRRGKYIHETDWSEDQPSAEEENRFLDKHGWGDYSKWYLGLDTGEKSQTKGHFAFPYGDFKKVHRDGVIAAKQRAAQNDYHAIEQAADELLEMIDEREAQKA